MQVIIVRIESTDSSLQNLFEVLVKQFYYLITHGTGLCLNEIVTVGDSDSYGSQWRDLPVEWFMQNNSEEDIWIYFITIY